jgi:hypothetical protein
MKRFSLISALVLLSACGARVFSPAEVVSTECGAGIACLSAGQCEMPSPKNVCDFTGCPGVVVDIGYFDDAGLQTDQLICVAECSSESDCTKGTTCAFGGCVPLCTPGMCPDDTACFFGACIPRLAGAAPIACAPTTIFCGNSP